MSDKEVDFSRCYQNAMTAEPRNSHYEDSEQNVTAQVDPPKIVSCEKLPFLKCSSSSWHQGLPMN